MIKLKDEETLRDDNIGIGIKSNENQINLFKLGNVGSCCPIKRVSNVRAFRIELEFRKVVFLGKGKTGAPGEKPLRAEKRTNNKLDLHDSTPNLEIEPWVTLVGEASALTTTPSLLPHGAIPQGYVQLHALLSVGQLFFDYPMELLTM